MILSLPERLVDVSDRPLYIRASIELPSAVVSVQVRSDTTAPPIDIVGKGITLGVVEHLITFTGIGAQRIEPAVRLLMVELRSRLAANHVVPTSLDGFADLYPRMPCLCGDIYAPIDSHCSACEVAKDLALERGLLEYVTLSPSTEGFPVYLRWVGETMRGGRVLQRDDGSWDWQPRVFIRDENIYSAVVVAHGGAGSGTIFTTPAGAQIPSLRRRYANRCKKAAKKARMMRSKEKTPGRRR